MMDGMILLLLLLIVSAASFYVWKAKKSGKKCIGCPDSGCCGSGEKHACSCCASVAAAIHEARKETAH